MVPLMVPSLLVIIDAKGFARTILALRSRATNAKAASLRVRVREWVMNFIVGLFVYLCLTMKERALARPRIFKILPGKVTSLFIPPPRIMQQQSERNFR